MADIAPLRIVYPLDSGVDKEIAQGTISDDGMLETTKVLPSQVAAVETMVSELNASERMFLRDARTSPETGKAAMVKTPVERGTPEFLDALADTAKRFYKVELRFDPAVFAGGSVLIADVDDDDDDQDIEDDTPTAPDMSPVEDAPAGIEV